MLGMLCGRGGVLVVMERRRIAAMGAGELLERWLETGRGEGGGRSLQWELRPFCDEAEDEGSGWWS